MSTTGRTEVKELILNQGILFGDVDQPKQSVYATTAEQKYMMGTELVFADGRHYRYARCGAANISKALMQQGALDQAELFEQDQTQTFPVIGDLTVTVEISTGLTLVEAQNELVNGTLIVNQGPGIGDSYTIKASKVGTTDTNLSLILDSPIRTTWTTATEISIKESLWMNTIVQVEPATAIPVGVPNIDVVADQFYWVQTQGPCGIIVDATETLVIGDLCGAPATQTTAGAVGIWVTLTKSWGEVMQVGTTVAEPSMIYLDLH